MRGGAEAGWLLVVDRDELFRRRVVDLLTSSVPCRSTASPREALALACEHPGLVAAIVDLVVDPSPGDLPEDTRNGLDHVAIPLRWMFPRLDIRVVGAAAAEFPGGTERVSDEGFSFMHKRSVEVLGRLGPVFAGRAEEEQRRSVEAQTLARVVDLASTHGLSLRQMEILMLKAQNLSNEQVAHALALSVKTVEDHSAKAKAKTGGRSLRELAREVAFDGRASGFFPRRDRVVADPAEDEELRANEAHIDARLRRLVSAHELSARQTEILRLKARHRTNEEIARVLGISVKTIEHHSKRAAEKTGRSLREWAREISFVHPKTSPPDGTSSNG